MPDANEKDRESQEQEEAKPVGWFGRSLGVVAFFPVLIYGANALVTQSIALKGRHDPRAITFTGLTAVLVGLLFVVGSLGFIFFFLTANHPQWQRSLFRKKSRPNETRRT